MAASSIPRRISEFLGVALFALALIWLIALVTYEPTDPVWFFTTTVPHPPANFVGRVGAFLAELSFQLFGYGAYFLPAAIGIVGWHYFWCQTPDAAYTKAFGGAVLLICASAFFSLVLGSTELAAKTFDAGGTVGAGLGLALAEYLNRTGSIIVLLTAMMLSVIMATQFSFGRLFATATVGSRDLSARGLGALRGWIDERRRERARREVIAKHTKKTGVPPPVIKPARPEGAALAPKPAPRPEPEATGSTAGAAGDQAQARDAVVPARSGAAQGAGAAEERRLCPAAAFAARRVQGRAQDRRARAHGARPPAARRSAASSRSRARWRRFTPGRWSPRSSSSPTPA